MALHFRNRYSDTIWIAFLYGDSGCTPTAFRKLGWWHVPSGQTFNAWNTDLRNVNRHAAFYAEASGGATWSGTGNDWYKISDKKFNQCFDDNSNCNKQPDFVPLDFNGNSDMTVVLGPAKGQLQISGGNTGITYHQVGACNGYDTSGGEVSAGEYQAFVTFQVEAVDNSRVGSAFEFDPSRLYIEQNGKKVRIDPNLAYVKDILGPFAVLPETVQPYHILGLNGYCTLVASTSNKTDPQEEANNTAYFLKYDGVLITKTNSSRTSWPKTQNCHDMTLS